MRMFERERKVDQKIREVACTLVLRERGPLIGRYMLHPLRVPTYVHVYA